MIKLSQFISLSDNITLTPIGYDRIYSYIMYAKYTDKVLSGFIVEYTISPIDAHNTLKTTDIMLEIQERISDILACEQTRYVVSYKQPSIDLQLELFQPYVHKLARKLYTHWNSVYEFEDLLQICNMIMVILYNKGYYINHSLLYRSVVNYILMETRKDRNKPKLLSLERNYTNNNGDISLEETIADMREIEERIDKEDTEYINQILKEKRDLVIDIIGQRQYDQLLREYGTNTVSLQARQQVHKLKVELDKLGITTRSFYK